MTARFVAIGDVVLDRKMTYAGHPTQVATADDERWAQMIADGLNMIVDQVAPWSPGAAHSPVVDGVVVRVNDGQGGSSPLALGPS